MTIGFNQMPTRKALADIAHDFYNRGWMAGTAGNLSARSSDSDKHFWITSSGLPKGVLDSDDFLLVDIESGDEVQRFRNEAKPSAETSIHRLIYRLFPAARACFHVHTVDACIATSRIPTGQSKMPLPPLEMIKGLDIWQQDPKVHLDLFDNILEVEKIAAEIEQRFAFSPPEIPALMIRSHGVTVWGESIQQAYNRIELVEFIMSYLARHG
jgi:methylthioribulose-1-phosphate dehydratase